jgi:hypothetical protein
LTPTLLLYDDARARSFEPFALTRPGGELRAGAELVRQRWERSAGGRAIAFAGAPHLMGFDEVDAPPAAAGSIPAGTILANTRFAPALSGLVDGRRLGFHPRASRHARGGYRDARPD